MDSQNEENSSEGSIKTKKSKYECGFCTYYTDKEDVLTMHVNNHHKQKDKKKEYHCESCSYFSDRKENLIRHVDSMHRQRAKKRNIIVKSAHTLLIGKTT